MVFITINGFSQSISMEFPAFAGKTYEFVIFQGSKTLTVVRDTIPTGGAFTIQVPKQYAPYTGMSRWFITGTAEGGGLDMAIPGHDFAVTCLSDKPNEKNITYSGYDPVNELNRLNSIQQTILSKFETMSKATQLYDKNHKLYSAFAKEAAVQAKAYKEFYEDLKKNPNFNARFLPIVNLTQGIPYRLTDDYEEKALLVNEFITQKVSFEDMWVSGHWQGIIQSWVVLQMNVVNDKAQFAQDFKQISDRMKNPVHYTDFVGKLTYYLTEYSKDDYIEAIAKTVIASGKVTEYVSSMQVYQKSMVGMKAASLIIKEPTGNAAEQKYYSTVLETDKLDSKYSLLVFYRSGCGPCEETMHDLQENYTDLTAKGIRIITISADTEEEVFKNTSSQLPWVDNYCNLEGATGANFKNYAVIGTPTMFLLDSKGIIIEKIATVQQLIASSED
jgi:thiol-disulfide isomerase/thioredoxin